MKEILFIILIISLICTCIKQKKAEYNKKVKEIRDFDVDCSKSGNRNLIKELGEEKFILIYGEDQYRRVLDNSDNTLVQPTNDWKDRLIAGMMK